MRGVMSMGFCLVRFPPAAALHRGRYASLHETVLSDVGGKNPCCRGRGWVSWGRLLGAFDRFRL